MRKFELPIEQDIHLGMMFLLKQKSVETIKKGFEFGTSDLDKETE